jgi:hypothetical protein
MTESKRYLRVILAIPVFLTFTVACTVNKIHLGAFNKYVHVENNPDRQNYLLKNDGSKVYGTEVTYKFGALAKHEIKIDDQKFKIPEVKAFMYDGVFYARMGSDYMRRIVHGKINIYLLEKHQDSRMPNGEIKADSSGYHYIQRGDDGNLTPLANQKDLKNAVSGCQKAVEMVDISYAKLTKAVRANPNYLNEAFELYNNDCKPLIKHK